jgi:hypothetical protein
MGTISGSSDITYCRGDPLNPLCFLCRRKVDNSPTPIVYMFSGSPNTDWCSKNKLFLKKD